MESIWYACYGSNLNLDRFLKYILGGKLPNRTKPYTPCIDTTPPVDGGAYIINSRLYFAKESGTWASKDAGGNEIKHGVGFISTKFDSRSVTHAKLYLISQVQFTHLFNLENSRKRSIVINYNELQNNKILDIPEDSNGDPVNFYNRIIKLESNYEGHPILTFTNSTILPRNPPKDDYAELIHNGIRDTHNHLSDEEIARYMRKAKR